jgi:probable rRNA maturation factor
MPRVCRGYHELMAEPKYRTEWQALAERRTRQVILRARARPGLLRRGSGATKWQVSVRVVGSAAMRGLNLLYRQVPIETDVLSFPAPLIFAEQGHLGELVICLSLLIRQASEHGHSPAAELDVLLVHGLLHLLGMDHERGKRHAAEMSRWERILLDSLRRKRPGLIQRVR